MADKIFPSTNDVGPVAGDGRIATEANLSDWRSSAAAILSHYRNGEQVSPGGVRSGFDFSSGTATSVTLTAGTAVIEGYKCEDTDTIVGTLTASLFNFVFLALTKSGGLVTGLELQVRTAATFDAALASVPADAILIWCFETDATDIVGQYDFRQVESGIVTGSYIGDDAATRTFNLGFRPKLVQVYRNEDPRFIAQSPLAVPRNITVEGMDPRHGLAIIDSGGFGNATPFISDDPELVPELHEDGFAVQDGPGTVQGVWLSGSKTHDPPNTANLAIWTTTVTVPGAASDGGICTAWFENAVQSDWTVEAFVSAADTVFVTFTNVSGGSLNLAEGELRVFCFEPAPVALWKLNELGQLYYFVAWF
jgi:hypothetical protein